IAVQDFDNTEPSWNYSSDVPFFDNGWGTDGYYSLIDITDAAPLDYSFFTNNILGENDLYDEGDNGTIGYATITFDTIDISSFNQVSLLFDWQYTGYSNVNSSIQYAVSYDGVSQGYVNINYGANNIEADSGTVDISIPDTINTVSLTLRIRHD